MALGNLPANNGTMPTITEQQFKDFQQFKQFQQLQSGQKGIGFKHDSPGAPAGPYGHGAGGLFNQPGQDMRVFSAMVQPLGGIVDALPVVYNDMIDSQFGGYEQELFTTITGVTASNQTLAAQPTAQCNPFPAGGLMKVCTLANPYGRYGASLRELNIERVGDLLNPSDPTYLQLAANMGQGGMAPTMPAAAQDLLINEFHRRAFEAYTGFRLWIGRRIWQGNPANSAASDGWRDVLGLDLQINSGNKRDFYTSNLCTAADSDIKNFGFNLVNGSGNDIVKYMDMMFFYLNWNSDRMGLSPTTWAIVMRPELFDEIVKIWPVRYYQEGLLAMNNFTNGRVVINANEMTTARDDYRNNLYLPIRGKRVNVILDEGITEYDITTNSNITVAGRYASDIYFVPMTVRGIPVTYIQPYRMNNPIAERIIQEGRVLNTWTSDGGLFRWYVRETRNCVTWDFVTRFRVVCRTPQLAGRIQNVMYEPLQHVRSAYPDSTYFANGGRTTGAPSPVGYTEWNGATQGTFPT